MADYDLFRESERESVDALWCLTALPRGTVALFFSAPRLDDRQSVRNPAGGGRSIERAAAGTFIPASTELGAKDPCRKLRAEPSLGPACPGHRIGYVAVCNAEFGELGAHRVGTVDAHGREHDSAILLGYIEVLGALDGRNYGLGKGQLILGRQFREHSQFLE